MSGANRNIRSRARGGSVQLTDCLASLFALELLAPSPELYLLSPWVSEVRFLDNRYGQLRSVLAESSIRLLGLSEILALLAERGTVVRLLCRYDQPQTQEFLRRLPPEVETRHEDNLHEKGLVTKHFYVRGSMNFTYSGINLNDESIEVTTKPEEVALALLEMGKRWKDARP